MIRRITILILLALTTLAYGQDRQADSLILVQVYNQLDGPNWNSPDNWLTAAPLEEWKGITVTNDRVTNLSIISQNPTGPFPEQIVGLDELTTFEVRSGNMTGSLPSDLTQLTKLSRFSVSGNNLSGPVPNIWTSFDNLRFLILQNNEFSGSLPDIPSGLTLAYLDGNAFTGPVPSTWEGVILSNLDIADNQLTGTLDVFGTWPVLSTMDFSENNWDEGPLPMWLDTLENLASFRCSDCNLVGGIPAGFDLRDNLVYRQAILDGNDIGGDVAALFTGENSTQDLFLNVNGNQFSGNFPAHLINQASSVDIRSNNFTSLTAFPDSVDFDGRFSVEYNKFTYEALEPMRDYIALDGDLEVWYRNMQFTLTPDTIEVTEPTTVTILSGDNHPNTTYQWVGPTVQGLTDASVDVVVDEFFNGGTFRCLMANEDFPDLQLRRNDVVIIKNFSTSIKEVDVLAVDIYPNPTTDQIIIKAEEATTTMTYKLLSSDGRLVHTGSVSNVGVIDVESLQHGVYYLEVRSDTKSISQIIVKQ